MGSDSVATHRRTLSVVVPVRNAVRTLTELDRRITEAFVATDWRCEVLYVDDRSDDGSSEVLADLAAARPGVRVVPLRERRGQHGALITGLGLASGAVLVTLDDDLSHPPEVLPPLCDVVATGSVDLVYIPLSMTSIGPIRRSAAVLIRRVLGIAMGGSMGAAVSPFRVFDARLVDDLGENAVRCPSVDLLLARRTRAYAVAAPAPPVLSADGPSRYRIVPLLVLAARMAVSSVGAVLRGGRATAVERALTDVTSPVTVR